jgi:putative transposase
VVNHKLVASITGQLAIHGLPRRRSRRRNLANVATNSDLVNRDFTATAANQLWVADITEHSTTESRVDTCVVLDAYSRRAVGWAISRKADTTLVNSAIDMAAQSRTITSSTIVHTDHRPQFTAWAFTTNLHACGLQLCIGIAGDCYDNALIESFRGGMQTELFNTKTWTTVEEHSTAIADYIENFHIHADVTPSWMCSPQSNSKFSRHPSCTMREPGLKAGGQIK